MNQKLIDVAAYFVSTSTITSNSNYCSAFLSVWITLLKDTMMIKYESLWQARQGTSVQDTQAKGLN